MPEISFKERIRLAMLEAAREYKEIYIDYEYLICSEAFKEKEYYIVNAEEDNFQHLTGVHSNLRPKEFFYKCYNGTLQETDFDFVNSGQDEKAVKGTMRRKIKVLPNMMALFQDGLQAEENLKKNRVSCVFATADGSCTLGFCESKKARPKSLIKGNELKNPSSVELILRKKTGETLFNDIVLGDMKAIDKYKNKIENLIDIKIERGFYE